jgi:hypothetical protein
MPLYGYARVFTLDQDLAIQQAALEGAGCAVIRAETRAAHAATGAPSCRSSWTSCMQATPAEYKRGRKPRQMTGAPRRTS